MSIGGSTVFDYRNTRSRTKSRSSTEPTGVSATLDALLQAVLAGVYGASSGLSDSELSNITNNRQSAFGPQGPSIFSALNPVGVSNAGLGPFVRSQPGLYTMTPEERAVTEALGGKNTALADTLMTPLQRQGLETLRSSVDPDAWSKYFNTIVGPQIANGLSATGGNKGSGAYGEYLSRYLTSLTPALMGGLQSLGRTQLGQGGVNFANLGSALGAGGMQRNLNLSDFERRQALLSQALLGSVPFTPSTATTGNQKVTTDTTGIKQEGHGSYSFLGGGGTT